MAVQVYQPGYSHFAYVHRANAGLLAYLECDGEPALVTDATWRTCRDLSYNELVPRMSIYQAGVEDRDMSVADGWNMPGYDDNGWTPARVVAAVGDAPWTGLVERRLPLVVERELPMKLLWVRQGPYPAIQSNDAHQCAARELGGGEGDITANWGQRMGIRKSKEEPWVRQTTRDGMSFAGEW